MRNCCLILLNQLNKSKVLYACEPKRKLLFNKKSNKTQELILFSSIILTSSHRLLNYLITLFLSLVIFILSFSCLTKARRKVWRLSRKYPGFPIPKINHSIVEQKVWAAKEIRNWWWWGGGQKIQGTNFRRPG